MASIYCREEPALAGRFRKATYIKTIIFHYVPSDRKVGLDALSEAKGHTIDLTILPLSVSRNRGLSSVPSSHTKKHSFVDSEEWGLVPHSELIIKINFKIQLIQKRISKLILY